MTARAAPAAAPAPRRHRAFKVILIVLTAICAIPVVIGFLVMGDRR